MATMSMMVNSDSMLLESIPRLRWSPKNNRFHFNMPVAAEPGENGFVLLQEFEHADSLSSMKLPPKERHHLEEMERINHLIHDVENSVHLHETVKVLEQKRMHHDEYHERALNDEEERPQGLKKKDSFRQRQPPKRSTWVAKTYEYIRAKKVAEPKQWKGEVRNHVSECLGFAPSTISAIWSHWETNHNPTFASTLGPKPAGRPRKFGENLHPLVRKLVSEMNKRGKPVAAPKLVKRLFEDNEIRFQCGHCDGCYGGLYFKKKVANLNRRNFPIRFDCQKAAEAQGFVSFQQA
ncbi:hypothetical protein C6341_g16274 [Phytophthora cactorum]|nr:hypothetical protein C6341_g16274 [Phytophthora cactorum]